MALTISIVHLSVVKFHFQNLGSLPFKRKLYSKPLGYDKYSFTFSENAFCPLKTINETLYLMGNGFPVDFFNQTILEI